MTLTNSDKKKIENEESLEKCKFIDGLIRF